MGAVIAAATGIIGLIILLVLIYAGFIFWAWNAVVPQVFGLPQIDLVQALALSVLATAFFKNTTISK